MYPSDKKDDDFNFKRVLQCFLPLAMYPFGLKGCKKINVLTNAPFGRFSLAMYHSDHFFLKALFLRAPRRSSPRSSSRGLLGWILACPLGPYRRPSLAEGIEKLEPSCYRQPCEPKNLNPSMHRYEKSEPCY